MGRRGCGSRLEGRGCGFEDVKGDLKITCD